MRNGANGMSDPSGREAMLSALGSAAVRFALLFSTAGVALALFLAPIMDRESRPVMARGDLDLTSTGSIAPPPSDGSYTIRRSVLSGNPSAVCVIRDNGNRAGAC